MISHKTITLTCLSYALTQTGGRSGAIAAFSFSRSLKKPPVSPSEEGEKCLGASCCFPAFFSPCRRSLSFFAFPRTFPSSPIFHPLFLLLLLRFLNFQQLFLPPSRGHSALLATHMQCWVGRGERRDSLNMQIAFFSRQTASFSTPPNLPLLSSNAFQRPPLPSLVSFHLCQNRRQFQGHSWPLTHPPFFPSFFRMPEVDFGKSDTLSQKLD